MPQSLLAVEGAKLGELAFEERAEAADVLLKLTLGLGHAGLHSAGLHFGFTDNRLCLALRGRAGFLAELLCGDERLVHRSLTLAEHAQLLGERGDALLQHLPLANRAFQRIR